jgi:hypothetical protein
MKYIKMFENNSETDSIIQKIKKDLSSMYRLSSHTGRLNRIRINSTDCINLKTSLNDHKLFNSEKGLDGRTLTKSHYIYNGDIISITSEFDGDYYNHYVSIIEDSESQDEFIKEVKKTILHYENKLTELEDAIQKIYHGGNE